MSTDRLELSKEQREWARGILEDVLRVMTEQVRRQEEQIEQSRSPEDRRERQEQDQQWDEIERADAIQTELVGWVREVRGMIDVLEHAGFVNLAKSVAEFWNELDTMSTWSGQDVARQPEKLIQVRSDAQASRNELVTGVPPFEQFRLRVLSSLEECHGRLTLTGNRARELAAPHFVAACEQEYEDLKRRYESSLKSATSLREAREAVEQLSKDVEKLGERCRDADEAVTKFQQALDAVEEFNRGFTEVESQCDKCVEQCEDLGFMNLATKLRGQRETIRSQLRLTAVKVAVLLPELAKQQMAMDELRLNITSAIAESKETLAECRESLVDADISHESIDDMFVAMESIEWGKKKRLPLQKEYNEAKQTYASLLKALREILTTTEWKELLSVCKRLLPSCKRYQTRIFEIGVRVEECKEEAQSHGGSLTGGSLFPEMTESEIRSKNGVTGMIAVKAMREAKKNSQGATALKLCFEGNITNARTGYTPGIFHWHILGVAQSNMIFTGRIVLGFVEGHIARDNPQNVVAANRCERRIKEDKKTVAVVDGAIYFVKKDG